MTVDFDSFQKILNRPGGFRDPGEPEEYCRGFQVFDKDMTGFIGVGQLRYSMFYLLPSFPPSTRLDVGWVGVSIWAYRQAMGGEGLLRIIGSY